MNLLPLSVNEGRRGIIKKKCNGSSGRREIGIPYGHKVEIDNKKLHFIERRLA